MPKTTITGPQQTDRSIAETLWNYRAEALWGLAVTVLLFACVNPMIVSGLLLAAATTTAACWAYRKIADGPAGKRKVGVGISDPSPLGSGHSTRPGKDPGTRAMAPPRRVALAPLSCAVPRSLLTVGTAQSLHVTTGPAVSIRRPLGDLRPRRHRHPRAPRFRGRPRFR